VKRRSAPPRSAPRRSQAWHPLRSATRSEEPAARRAAGFGAAKPILDAPSAPRQRPARFSCVLVAKTTSPGLLAIKTRGDALRREGAGAKGRLVVKQTVDRFITACWTSMPTRSASAKGPMRTPVAPVRMRSMSATEAMPSLSRRCASGTKARPTWLTRNAGLSVHGTGSRAIRRARFNRASLTQAAVFRPGMISTSRISGTGLKKCMPHTRSGRTLAGRGNVRDWQRRYWRQ